ncbi:UbiX family flavin prenyltransferase [Roseiconus nitratireducens]|uniref:Flavin prenyltransferase UbiX n=1 Tax=Roseiconus nitratireducens TaxID=2605748 RepID=A0A5M6CZI3_9BACT|nr:flavin prenyltransferase UbiX [Roseiconus nitratireducens]KAA5540634.1 UbiX family flavin prenyltransferase [Roseiconus nitratireducens]
MTASNRSPDSKHSPPVVVGITGASGAMYAIRLLQSLCQADIDVHVTVSPSGAAVIRQETGMAVNLQDLDLLKLVSFLPDWSSERHRAWVEQTDWRAAVQSRLHYHRHDDFLTPIASGSFRTRAMVVCPCSGSTMSAIARAAASNLISRAAEVHLKEHRKLVIVPRETPVSVLQLENMQRIAAAGGVVLPAAPGWYHGVDSLDSLLDFVVSRILDQLDVENHLIRRWKEDQ